MSIGDNNECPRQPEVNSSGGIRRVTGRAKQSRTAIRTSRAALISHDEVRSLGRRAHPAHGHGAAPTPLPHAAHAAFGFPQSMWDHSEKSRGEQKPIKTAQENQL